jgi:hypothetical protein
MADMSKNMSFLIETPSAGNTINIICSDLNNRIKQNMR